MQCWRWESAQWVIDGCAFVTNARPGSVVKANTCVETGGESLIQYREQYGYEELLSSVRLAHLSFSGEKMLGLIWGIERKENQWGEISESKGKDVPF